MLRHGGTRWERNGDVMVALPPGNMFLSPLVRCEVIELESIVLGARQIYCGWLVIVHDKSILTLRRVGRRYHSRAQILERHGVSTLRAISINSGMLRLEMCGMDFRTLVHF